MTSDQFKSGGMLTRRRFRAKVFRRTFTFSLPFVLTRADGLTGDFVLLDKREQQYDFGPARFNFDPVAADGHMAGCVLGITPESKANATALPRRALSIDGQEAKIISVRRITERVFARIQCATQPAFDYFAETPLTVAVDFSICEFVLTKSCLDITACTISAVNLKPQAAK